MENITRKNKQRAALEAGVRMDGSVVQFKNNKLSENLGSTLDVIFRKKNSARIHQQNQVSKARKDYEYLQAVKEKVKQVHEYGPTTSASTRQRLNEKVTSVPEQVLQKNIKGNIFDTTVPKQLQVKIPFTSVQSSSSVSASSDSSGTEDDVKNDPNDRMSGTSRVMGSNKFVETHKKQHLDSFQPKNTSDFLTAASKRKEFLWGKNNKEVSRGSHFRYTRGPSFNAAQKSRRVAPTKSSFLMETVVYDPGDIYLSARRKSETLLADSQRRARTAQGLVNPARKVREQTKSLVSRQCQSASMSRRKLREMNNIDNLIESSDTPLIYEKIRQLCLTDCKHKFWVLQTRVSRFLLAVDEFNKSSHSERDPAAIRPDF